MWTAEALRPRYTGHPAILMQVRYVGGLVLIKEE